MLVENVSRQASRWFLDLQILVYYSTRPLVRKGVSFDAQTPPGLPCGVQEGILGLSDPPWRDWLQHLMPRAHHISNGSQPCEVATLVPIPIFHPWKG